MKTNRRTLLQGATSAAAALAVSGKAFSGASVSAQSASPIAGGGGEIDNLRIGTASIPTTYDPQVGSGLAWYRVFDMNFDRLMRQDWSQNGKIVPALATSWKQIDDLTLEFKLRDDVLFHDGSKFTAADVKYTYERTIPGIADKTIGFVDFFSLKEVNVVDDYTVQLVTKAPSGGLLLQLLDYVACIIPKDYHSKVGSEAFAQAPIGTGPFQRTAWTPGQSMEFTRFDGYWGGKSAAKKVTVSQVPELSTRIAGLLNGDSDLILDVSSDQVDAIKNGGNFQIESTVPLNVNLLTFNGYHEPMGKKEIRQALSLAIDRQTVVDTLFDGNAVVPGSLQSTLDPLYIERAPLAFDVDKAKQLLAAGGYNGEELRFVANNPSYYPLEQEWVSTITSMWSDIGVKATILGADSSPDLSAPNMDDRPFEVRTGSYTVYVDTSVATTFSSDTAVFPFDFPAGTFTDIITAVNKAAATIDQTERAKLYQSALDLIDDEVPLIVLWTINRIAALAPNLIWNQEPSFGINLRPSNFGVPA